MGPESLSRAHGQRLTALRNIHGLTAAHRLPDGFFHPWTVFGVPNAELHAISVSRPVPEPRRAAAGAEVDTDTVPSVDRRSRLWLEMARSYHQEHDHVAAHGALTRAYDTSPDAITYHPLARAIAGDLVDHGDRVIERDTQALAAKLGLIT